MPEETFTLSVVAFLLFCAFIVIVNFFLLPFLTVKDFFLVDNFFAFFKLFFLSYQIKYLFSTIWDNLHLLRDELQALHDKKYIETWYNMFGFKRCFAPNECCGLLRCQKECRDTARRKDVHIDDKKRKHAPASYRQPHSRHRYKTHHMGILFVNGIRANLFYLGGV